MTVGVQLRCLLLRGYHGKHLHDFNSAITYNANDDLPRLHERMLHINFKYYFRTVMDTEGALTEIVKGILCDFFHLHTLTDC